MNRPIHFLVQLELVFKQSSSSCCSHFDIMRPRRQLTIDQQYLATARLLTGCSQTDVATELRVSQSVIIRLQQRNRETGRVTERHRSELPVEVEEVDDLQGYLNTPPGTGVIVLHGPRSINAGRGTSGTQCCSLMEVDSHSAEMMAANDAGDVKESAMHQPLLSPDEPLVVVVVLQCGQVCLVST